METKQEKNPFRYVGYTILFAFLAFIGYYLILALVELVAGIIKCF